MFSPGFPTQEGSRREPRLHPYLERNSLHAAAQCQSADQDKDGGYLAQLSNLGEYADAVRKLAGQTQSVLADAHSVIDLAIRQIARRMGNAAERSRALAGSGEIQHAVADMSGRLGGMRDAFEHARQAVDAINRSAAELGDTARAPKSGPGVFRT